MEELIDGGFPHVTEPNLIKEMFDTPGALGYSAGMTIVCLFFSFKRIIQYKSLYFLVKPEATGDNQFTNILASFQARLCIKRVLN